MVNRVTIIPVPGAGVLSADAASHGPDIGWDPGGRFPLVPQGRRAPAVPFALDHFVVGGENRLASTAFADLLGPTREKAAAETAAPPRGPRRHLGPILLIGASGSGKSHLARGLAMAWSRRGRRVVCLTGKQLTAELAAATPGSREGNVSDGGMQAVGIRHRQADLFVVDGIDGLGEGKTACDQLTHTLDALERAEATVLITSRRPPGRLGLPAALTARLTAGLVLNLALPGPETRRALLHAVARAKGMRMTDLAADMLSEHIQGSVPQLDSALSELAPEGRLIEASSVRRLLKGRPSECGPQITSIVAAVAHHYGVRPAEIRGSARYRPISTARAVAMYLCRVRTSASLAQIGAAMGHRDHSTVLYNCRRVRTLSVDDLTLQQAIAEIQARLDDSQPIDKSRGADKCRE